MLQGAFPLMNYWEICSRPAGETLSACVSRNVMLSLHYILAALSMNWTVSFHQFIFASILAAVYAVDIYLKYFATCLRMCASFF